MTCFDPIPGDAAVLAAFLPLPADVQQEAKRAYRRFRANPTHPGLHFKKVEGHDNVYSARISLG